MNDLDKMVITAAMRKMFNDGYVQISSIDKCLKLASIIPDRACHERLSALHCVSFKDMSPELAEMIPAMIVNLFSGLEMKMTDIFLPVQPKIERVVTPNPAPPPQGLLKMLGLKP